MYPSDLIYEIWPESDMITHDTRKRLASAKEQELEIQSLNSHGVAKIKGTTDQIYETSLKSCTCTDFERRQLPCKHMLKLALYTGALRQDDDLYHLPAELEKRIKALGKKNRKALVNFCKKPSGQDIVTHTVELDQLFSAGFLVETVDPAYLINQKFTMDNIRYILQNSEQYAAVYNSKLRKAELIQQIIDAGSDCVALFTSRYTIMQLDPEIVPYAGSIADKYTEQ